MVGGVERVPEMQRGIPGPFAGICDMRRRLRQRESGRLAGRGVRNRGRRGGAGLPPATGREHRSHGEQDARYKQTEIFHTQSLMVSSTKLMKFLVISNIILGKRMVSIEKDHSLINLLTL